MPIRRLASPTKKDGRRKAMSAVAEPTSGAPMIEPTAILWRISESRVGPFGGGAARSASLGTEFPVRLKGSPVVDSLRIYVIHVTLLRPTLVSLH